MYQRVLFVLIFLFTINQFIAQQEPGKKELLSVISRDNADTALIDAYNELCWPIYSYDNPDSSIIFGEKAIELSTRKGDLKRLSIAHRRLGITYSNIGDLKRSIRHQEESFNLSKQLGWERGMYLALNNMGVAYLNNELLSQALSYFLKSLNHIAESQDPANLSKIYTNCGMIYRRTGDIQKSKTFFLKAKQFAELSKDSNLVITNYCNLSAACRGLNQIDSADYYLKKARPMITPNTDRQTVYNYYLGEGLLWGVRQKYGEALLMFEKTKPYVSGLSDEITLIINIADQYRLLNDYEKSLSHYNRAFELSKQNKFYDNMEFITLQISKVQEKKNNMPEFAKAIKLHIAYKDSNAQINKAHELIGKQLEFDYQRKHVSDSIQFEQKEKIKNVELEMAAAKLSREKVFRVMLVCVVLLILVLAILIFTRLVLTRKQKNIIENQKHLVETRNQEITDSINYAKRLQEAILPQLSLIREVLNINIFYLPKDVIGGDFYFFEQHENLIYFAVCDCTGHGIPGSLMSVVCHHALEKSIKEFNLSDPAMVLDKTREIIVESLNARQQNIKDGMDCSLFVYDPRSGTMKWAGANNPLWIIQDNALFEVKGDKQPVALYEHPKNFTSHEVSDFRGAYLILTTDGYADQFGGPNAKKYKTKTLKEFLLSVSGETPDQQVQQLKDNFMKWKGQLDQVDDVCIAVIQL